MPQPLNILHIIARLNVGGPAVYLIQLVTQQQAAGHHAAIVCGQIGKGEADMRYLAENRTIPITEVASLGREISLRSDLHTLFALWRLIRAARPDVVHTHTAKAGFVGRVAAWLAGVPVVVHTYHGHVFSGYFGKRKTALFIALERLCARLSTRLITLSETLKRELAERYRIAPLDKFAVIELGFELEALASAQRHTGNFRAAHNIPADVPLVGIVGRLVPIKNHALFLQAAQRLATPNVHFVIVGDGELRAELESQAAQLGIADRVHFAGWIKDPLPVFATLDAVVLCSNNEGLPVSLIEAMAAGVPIVATAVGGVPDLLEGGRLGTLVPPQDAEALATALAHTLATPHDPTVALQMALQIARQAALTRYSIEHSAVKTEALYRQLLPKRPL